MTTTKALAKLYKTITGSEGRNSAAKILSDLADNWSTTGGSIPVAPSASGDYKITVNASGKASWAADTIPVAPSTAGNYKLTVNASGVASWASIT